MERKAVSVGIKNPGTPPMEDQMAHLELALIEQYIRACGFDPAKLHELPDDQRHRLQRQAAAHAAMKLAEMEARAHYVHELHASH
jgi:hypothetical protein